MTIAESKIAPLVLLLLLTFPLIAAGKDAPAKAVNINTATVEELERLPEIGRARAEMIVRIRERNGPFKKVEELRALPRLSVAQFDRLKDLVTVGKPETIQSQKKEPEN